MYLGTLCAKVIFQDWSGNMVIIHYIYIENAFQDVHKLTSGVRMPPTLDLRRLYLDNYRMVWN